MCLLEKAFNLSSAGTEPNYENETSIEVSKELLFTVIYIDFRANFLYIPFWFVGLAKLTTPMNFTLITPDDAFPM